MLEHRQLSCCLYKNMLRAHKPECIYFLFICFFLQLGRCWIFSCLNVMRLPFMKKFNIEEFEFSQSYLFFWDKVKPRTNVSPFTAWTCFLILLFHLCMGVSVYFCLYHLFPLFPQLFCDQVLCTCMCIDIVLLCSALPLYTHYSPKNLFCVLQSVLFQGRRHRHVPECFYHPFSGLSVFVHV